MPTILCGKTFQLVKVEALKNSSLNQAKGKSMTSLLGKGWVCLDFWSSD